MNIFDILSKNKSIPNNTQFLTILINRLLILFSTLLIRVPDVFAFKKAKNRNLLAGCFDEDERHGAKRAQRETPGVKSRNGFFFPEQHLSNYSEIKKPTPQRSNGEIRRRGGVGRARRRWKSEPRERVVSKKGRRTFAREMWFRYAASGIPEVGCLYSRALDSREWELEDERKKIRGKEKWRSELASAARTITSLALLRAPSDDASRPVANR